MKVANFKKAVACLVVSGMAVFGGNAFAVEQDLQAPVEILETLSMSSPDPIDFGTVESPDGTSKTLIITKTGSVSGTATAIGDDSDNGSVVVSGNADAQLNVSAAGSCDTANLTLSDFTFTTPTLNGSGTLDLAHGATLTLDDSNDDLEAGSHTCDYTITASYQ